MFSVVFSGNFIDMASLWKRSDSRYWVACFTDTAGKRRKRSTNESDRRKAQRIADAFEDIARRRKTVAQVRRVMSDVVESILGEGMLTISLRAHCKIWLEEKMHTTAPATLRFYDTAVRKVLEHLGAKSDGPMDLITRADLIKLRGKLAVGSSSATVNHALVAVRMIFKAAKRDGVIIDDPSEHVESLREETAKARRPFKVDELKAVLEACHDEWRSMVLCGLYTGQRLGDLAAITWANVDLDKGFLRLRTQKTGRSILIPLAAPLKDHLASIRGKHKESDPVHPTCSDTFHRAGTSQLSAEFAGILATAGLREAPDLKKKGTGKGRGAKRENHDLSFHSLRHTAVSMLKEAGVPQAVVQEFVGHDTVRSSQQYTTIGDAAMVAAAAKLPRL